MPRSTLSAMLALAATFMVACSSQPAPSSQGDADGVCRPPLTEDEARPIGSADGEHEVFRSGREWWNVIARALADEHTEDTAGMWLDQEAGEAVVMITADDPEPILEDLRANVDDEYTDRVVCMRAEHTLAELTDLQARASAHLEDFEVPGTRSIDTVRNRVVVEYETDLDEAEDALGELADHPAVHVTRPACAEIAELPPDAVPLPGGGSTCTGMDALIEGELAGDLDGGCLWLEHEQSKTAILWPRGWWVSPDGVVHDHRGKARAELGEDVLAGGGSSEPPTSAIPGECRVSEEVWILSSLERSPDEA